MTDIPDADVAQEAADLREGIAAIEAIKDKTTDPAARQALDDNLAQSKSRLGKITGKR